MKRQQSLKSVLNLMENKMNSNLVKDIKFIDKIVEKLNIHKNNPDITQLDYALDMLEDWKHELCSIKPKRHPDSNGVLPMTTEDLKGLTKAYRYDFSILKAVSVRLSLTHLELVWDRLPPEVIENVAAILYLDKLFELEEKKYEHL